MCLDSGLLQFHIRGEVAHVHAGHEDWRGEEDKEQPIFEEQNIYVIRNLKKITKSRIRGITWPKANTKLSLD